MDMKTLYWVWVIGLFIASVITYWFGRTVPRDRFFVPMSWSWQFVLLLLWPLSIATFIAFIVLVWCGEGLRRLKRH